MSLKNQKTKSDFIEWNQMQSLVSKLERDGEHTFALLIATGSYLGLRVSDLLELSYNSILEHKEIEVTEKKTGKVRTILIHEELKEIAIRIYKVSKSNKNSKLFLNRNKKVLSIQYINRKLKVIEQKYQLGIKLSTHSCRKTFGRRIWNRNNNSEKALIMLGSMFNHASVTTTKIYLGIKQQEISNLYMSL
jgi:integrase